MKANATLASVLAGLALLSAGGAVVALGWTGQLQRKHEAGRRTADEALRHANEQLNARVVERTGELAAANQALLQQNSERTRMLEALSKGEERYRSLARSLPNAATLVFDHDLRYVMAEGADLLTSMGLDANGAVGQILYELASTGNTTTVEATYRGALTGQSGIVDLEVRGRSLRVHVGPVYEAGGAITGGMAFFYDVTMLKQAEALLQESEARMRGLAEAAFEGIALIDGGALIEANSALCEMFGKSRQELVATPWIELVDWFDRPAITEHIAQGTTGARETTGVRVDGAHFPIAVRARRVAWRDRELQAVAFQDLTSSRLAEAAAREATTLWRGILDGADYSIIATDTEGVITEFNPAAERMLGYDAAEVVGLESPGLFHDLGEVAAHADAVSRELQMPLGKGFEVLVAKARRGISDQNEWNYVRKDGSRFPVLVSVSALRGPTGAIFGFIAIGSDIREQKRTERELIRARDAAERAMRVRSDFLARMSHEIRTPLNGILGMIDLVLLTRVTDEQRDYLETTQASARSLLGIINDILDFSKVDSGKLRLENIPFRPRSALGSALRVLGPLAQRKGVKLLLNVAADVPEGVLGDPQRITQVLTNLVSNAIKFTDRGDIIVSVAVVAGSEGAGELQVKVRDTGIGIPPEKQQMIFDAFSQADEATTRRYGGTGLGLAICAQLVELMEGRIWVHSALGEGSEFGFAVPLVIDIAQKAHRPAPKQLAGLRALVVDEHAGQGALVKDLLQGWNIEAVHASGTDALATASVARESGRAFGLLVLEGGLLAAHEEAGLSALRAALAPEPLVVLLGGGGKAQAVLAERLFGLHAMVAAPVLASSLLETIEALATGRAPAGLQHEQRGNDAGKLFAHGPIDILVAEDNAINRKVVRGMLEHAGHKVETVENGQQALAAIARKRFDIVVMDVEMPVMDGLEATRTLRATEAAKQADESHLPIIALTAQAMKGDRERCLQVGMDAYLTKPIDRLELLRVIARLVTGTDEAGDLAGFDPAGFDPAGFDPAGFDPAGFDPAGLGNATSARPADPVTQVGSFDRSKLLGRLGGDEELCAGVIDLFLKEAPAMLAELKAAFQAQAAPPLERAAHKLRGVLLNLGAQPSAAHAESIEVRARARELASAGLAIESLENELASLAGQLEAAGAASGGAAGSASGSAT